jgi:hypothetical protein
VNVHHSEPRCRHEQRRQCAPGFWQYPLVPDEGVAECGSARDISPGISVGRRVRVAGMAGAGKSTFSRALSAKTGLPVIHLDVHFWKPGWVESSVDEWREKQRDLPAKGGSSTATTTPHSTFGLSAKTRSCFSICRGGSVHGERSSAGFAGVRLTSSCRAAAMSRLGDVFAKNGRWPGASGEFSDPRPTESSEPGRRTNSVRRSTFSAPHVRPVTSSAQKRCYAPIRRWPRTRAWDGAEISAAR